MMIDNQIILILVLLLPLMAAVLNLFFWGKTTLQRYTGNIFVILHLIVSILLLHQTVSNKMVVLNVGNWLHAYGIVLGVDMFSGAMILLSSFLAVLAWFYSSSWMGNKSVSSIFNVVFFTLLMGLTGSFMAADLFNLYVWFEVMLVSSFVLLTLGAKKFQLEGAIKYVAINVFASTIFLAGVGLIYGLTGTINMAVAGMVIESLGNHTLVNVAGAFFLIAFGIKAAIFPLFFWLPASYHTAPIGFSSLLMAMMTKVGVYTLIRFFTLIIPVSNTPFQLIFMILAGFTMVVGVLGAAAQTDFRRILSFHIVSQIGYMLMGLAIGTPLAIAGALFFILHNVLVKTNLFFIAGLIGKNTGTYSLQYLGGIFAKLPVLALLFAISAFSLTGVPPLTGFWGKFILAKAGFLSGDWIIVTVSLIVSLFTLFSMTKIWNYAFWKPLPEGKILPANNFAELFAKNKAMLLVIFVLTVVILWVSFMPNRFLEFAEEAARFVVNREEYMGFILNKN
ncbi:MAG: pH regulation protein D [Prolixibacteraceae bacterium]|jgi:multicomponent Na+:H+ antiporter subunit D|nr:pH regulation protein D [Prolixibacteraceae bacterium]